MPEQDGMPISARSRPEKSIAEKTVPLTFGLTLFIFSIFAGGLFLAPYLRSRSSAWAGLVYAVYAPFCHQLPERSMHCFGQPLAVCSRCLGIYLGAFLGLILHPFVRGWRVVGMPGRKIFFTLSVPIVLDVAANTVGLWQSSDAVRLVTGSLWGALLPFYFLAGVVDFLESAREKRRIQDKNST